MIYITLGAVAFAVIHVFDIVALKRLPYLKPVVWFSGCALGAYSLVMIALTPGRLALPLWSVWLGGGLLLIAGFLLLYSLFLNLPFRKTYVATGVGQKLIKTGLYALVRHPGVTWFVLLMLSFILVSRSRLLLVAAPIFVLLDIVLVVLQDRYFFVRMFPGYRQYQKETPMLVPNRHSIRVFIKSLKREPVSRAQRRDIMPTLGELLEQGRMGEVWQKCCGFIDLSLPDFMKIQKRLLLEQIELLKKCELGNFIMQGTQPRSVAEFREMVPLTTYAAYAPYLLKRRRNVLPAKPIVWIHTSGRSGEYSFKWVPITKRQYEEMGAPFYSTLIFGSCKQRGEVALKRRDKILYALAPSPYFSGLGGRRIYEEDVIDFIPPLDEAEKMQFADRIKEGFQQALVEGMDWFGGLSSILVAVGERFSQGGGKMDIKPLLRRPGRLFSLVTGLIKSKLARRPLLPRDIWKVKGILASGTDTQVFREKIKEMWGVYPIEAYGCTEGLLVALQTWDFQGMTFLPHLNFLEFIPEEDSRKSREDPTFKPRVLLVDEVKAGEKYEMVVSNFYGGPLARYRLGDLVHITALRNEQLNIDIPQMEFYARCDDVIDIAGFTRLTEGIIWQAIDRSGLGYADWAVRKEVSHNKTLLHLYIELKPADGHTSEQVTAAVHEELKKLDTPYADLESFTNLKPLRVTLLPENAFQSYMMKQKAAGADLAHLKIPHINPTDSMIEFLMQGVKAPVAGRAATRAKSRGRRRGTGVPSSS